MDYMEILLSIGFWVLLFVYLMFIHVMILGLAGIIIIYPASLLGFRGNEIVIGANFGAAIALFTLYNKLWILSFNEHYG
tara:strand:+ start:886 stop:1122 length:237 start_codon:yes stop_codon:yes gene_type:complete